jgi:quinol monooxygenase YgiN
MHARMMTAEVPEDRRDERLGAYAELLARAKKANGCMSTLLAMDNANGDIVLMTFWDDPKAMASSDDLFRELVATCEFLQPAAPEKRELEVHRRD